MTAGPFIAVDWGTTNRRALRIEQGAVAARVVDGTGVKAVRDFAAEVGQLRTQLGDLPMLISGMAGSSIGWHEAPYVPLPATLEALAQARLAVDDRTWIVPGVCWQVGESGDVMRGEEVQVLGAARAGLIPQSATIVQPGTHSKWITLNNGQITDFVTVMTGELFALLKESLIGPLLLGLIRPDDVFLAGVERGAQRDIARDLFGIRAASLLRLRSDEQAAAFCSGLLIGAECTARLTENGPFEIFVLADDKLGPLYVAAIAWLGRQVRTVDAESSYIAGAAAIMEML